MMRSDSIGRDALTGAIARTAARVWMRATGAALAALALALVGHVPTARADGMPADLEVSPSVPSAAGAQTNRRKGRAVAASDQQRQGKPAAQRDPLAVDPALAARDEPVKEVDLPGVMKLPGADPSLLDPTRVREVHWRNRGIVTVWVSDHQVNRIQLPFANPRVIATDGLAIQKRAGSNNVYLHYEGEPAPEQVWFEPAGESAVSIGLQLVPKRIPAQDIVVLDDTTDSAGAVGGTAGRSRRAGEGVGGDSDYFSRVQSLMEQAALGALPAGFSDVALDLPSVAADGLMVRPLRRLSGRGEDLYVYELTNVRRMARSIQEEEFDGERVRAVSILPKPVLAAGERAVLVVLAGKASPPTYQGAQVFSGGRP